MGLRVVLAIDEIEWLVPTATDPANEDERRRASDFLSVMGSLRGLKHDLGEDSGPIVCCINESVAEIGTLLKFPNPIVDFFRCHYMAGAPRLVFQAGHSIARAGSSPSSNQSALVRVASVYE